MDLKTARKKIRESGGMVTVRETKLGRMVFVGKDTVGTTRIPKYVSDHLPSPIGARFTREPVIKVGVSKDGCHYYKIRMEDEEEENFD